MQGAPSIWKANCGAARIGFKLADMATDVEAARLLTYQAAWLESEGFRMEKNQRCQKYLRGYSDEGDD